MTEQSAGEMVRNNRKTVMIKIVSFICGIIFSWGLLLSGMANPHKVLNFLTIDKNFMHSWDPSLILVMVGGVATMMFCYYLIGKKYVKHPLYGESFMIPTSTLLTKRLFIGSAIFGMGWGLTGICPGPAITLLITSTQNGLYFVIPLLIAMLITLRTL